MRAEQAWKAKRSAFVSQTLFYLLGAFVLVLMFPTPASNQESPAAEDARWKKLNVQVLQFLRQGEYAKGVAVAQEALRVAEATFGPEHANTATALNNVAGLYMKQARYREAEPLLRRSLAIWEKVLGPEHPDVANSLNNLAGLYMEQGRYAEAEPLFGHSLAIRENALGPRAP